MTKTLDSEPWRGLPTGVADLIEPELDSVVRETIEAIGAQVPEYARPLEGSFGRGVRTGVEEALRQFVALIRNPEAGRGVGREVYVSLGRGELRQGRTLDSLQAAYRVGARIAWRRISAAGRTAGLEPEELSLLAEAIFAYIDELSADAVEGYAEAQAELEDLRRRRRRELVVLLLRSPAPTESEFREAAEAAAWAPPRRIAALACAEADVGPLSRRLPPDVLAAVIDDCGCLLVPDAGGPGRATEVARAARGRSAALGPAVSPSDLAGSWELARATLRAAGAGALGAGLRVAEEHLGDLLVIGGAAVAERIRARRLTALDGLTSKAAARMRETALAYVRHGGNSVAMAGELHVHPQTVRYRIAKLRELLGPQLDDPDARFELEVALRGLALSGAGSSASS